MEMTTEEKLTWVQGYRALQVPTSIHTNSTRVTEINY